jgi:hypothetical protein
MGKHDNGNPGDRAELHHAAPEMGHPQHLYRQPADADAVARRPDRLAERGRCAKKAGIEDNDWIEAYNANGAMVARAVVSQRVQGRHVMMYHAQEKIVNVPAARSPCPRRHPQLGHPHRAQADPHDRRLRAAELRLQLLRHRRRQSRRVRHRAQDGKVDWLDRRVLRHPISPAAEWRSTRP